MPVRIHARRASSLFAAVAAVQLVPATSYAADLVLTKAFLDSKGGFIDFKQIDHTLGPGGRVLIEGHTRRSLTLVNLVYGEAGSPISVTNTGSQPLIIDAASAVEDGIRIWGAQHVVFTGSPVGTDPYGIKVYNTIKVGIAVDQNNHNRGDVDGEFENTTDLVIAQVEVANTGFAGIKAKYELSEYPDEALLDGLEIHHTYIHDTAGEGMYIGWTSDGHPDVANVSIHDNLVREAGWDGIQLNRSRGQNSIHDNVVDGYASLSPEYGAFTQQNEGISVGGARTDVWNNLVKASNEYSGSALFFTIYEPSRIFNNVFVHGGFGSSSPEAAMYIRQRPEADIAARPGATLTIANNTIVEPDFHGIWVNPDVDKPVSVINNVIAGALNGGEGVHDDAPVTETTNQSYASVAQAMFSGPDDYHPAAGSPLIDGGTNVSSQQITDDYDGTTRPQGAAYDVGAYERRAQGAVVGVLTPAGWGTAVGSAFCGAVGAFDAPPVWSEQAQAPAGDQAAAHADTGTAYANRFWYVDFGPGWASVRIVSTWTRYRPFSGGSYGGFASLWWDDDRDTVNDGVAAFDINFATAQALPDVSTQQWVQDAEFDPPATPAGRYLIIGTGGSPTPRANEFTFVGYREP